MIMKRFLFCMVSLLLSMSAWAQNWQAPSANDYPESTPIYVGLVIDGQAYVPQTQMLDEYEVAAFIRGDQGEECRADAQFCSVSNNVYYYQLNVRGTSIEKGKAKITFKIYAQNSGVVFLPSEKVTFDGETHGTLSSLFNISLTSVQSVKPGEINLSVGQTANVADYLVIQPDNATPFVIEWDYASKVSAQYFTLADGQVTAEAATPAQGESPVEIGVSAIVGHDPNGGPISFTIPVNIIDQVGIQNVGDITSFTINKGDNLMDYLPQYYVITPDNAPDKTVSWTSSDQTVINAQGTALKAGTTTITVTANANQQASISFTVNVVVPVTGLEVSQNAITVVKGDNAYAAISNLVTILPADATYDKKDLIFEQEGDPAAGPTYDVVDAQGVAIANGTVVVWVTDQQGSNYREQVTVTVVTPVTSISVSQQSVTVNKGTHDIFNTVIAPLVTVLPDGASDPGLTYNSSNTAVVDEQGDAKLGGQSVITINSMNYPDVAPATITVVVQTPLEGFTIAPPMEVVRNQKFMVQLTPVPADATVDEQAVSLECTSPTTANSQWVPAIVGAADVLEPTPLAFGVTPLVIGDLTIEVYYNGKPVGEAAPCEATVNVAADYSLTSGWNWWSVYMNNDPDYPLVRGRLNNTEYFDDKLQDMRSMNELLYNDPVYGLFGDITAIDENKMYKVKLTSDVEFALRKGATPSLNQNLSYKWNWLVYPYQYNHSFDEVKAYFDGPSEGDMIVSKSGGFAEFSNGSWVSSLNTFNYGEGYMYYSESPNGMVIDWAPETSLSQGSTGGNGGQGNAPARLTSHWRYDSSRFMNNMAMIAQMDNVDNPERFSIGAFVGDECRGESKVAGGCYFITIHADAKEQISFRAYDNETGEEFDLNEQVQFKSKLGSVNAPVMLTTDHAATGIADTVMGSRAAAVEGIYDLNGRRVSQMTHGVYIMKTLVNGKIVSKKITK